MLKQLVFICLILAICFAGCGSENSEDNSIDSEKIVKIDEKKYISNEEAAEISQWAEIYQVTLESYLAMWFGDLPIYQDTLRNYLDIEFESDLLESINFMAIDLLGLQFINDYNKNEIIEYFEGKYVPIIDANLDNLEVKGLLDERKMIHNGILLRISGISKINNEIIVSGYIYRRPLGAATYDTIWRLKNETWEFVGTILKTVS